MRRPNLLLIMSDQHNPHITGYAGDPWVRTPNLDALAATGVVCGQTYCAAPLCVPSRMAFLTGQYPHDLEIWTNGGELPSCVPTFAHSLAVAGYDTVLCGRMHFVGADQNHGFSRRLVGDVSGAMTGGRSGEMFEGVWSQAGCGQSHGSLLPAAVGSGTATYELYDTAVTERACDWLRVRGREERVEPFCLVVGLLLPHNPYVCSRVLFEEYMDRLGPAPVAECENEHPAVRALKATRGADRITPEQARRARAAYYGLVTTLDRNVGSILAALEASGLLEDTVVAYTSDHGDLCGEHGLWWKDSFYEGSVGVPLIWSNSARVRSGGRFDAAVSLLDVAPTLIEYGEAEPLPAARGRSLVGTLGGDAGGGDGAAATAFAETFALGQRPARMIRTGRWKLNAYHGYDTVQLFDLAADPEEVCDLGAAPEYADVRQELLARVRESWNGARVEQRSPERSAEAALARRGRRAAAQNHVAECWPFPVGGNRRDQA